MKSTGSEEMKEVYLDNSATTMAYRSVGELVQKVMCEDYGNPSSMHNKGVEAEKYIKECLESSKERDLVFTISVEGHSPYPTNSDIYNFPIKVVNSSLSKSDQNQIYYYINKIHNR